MAYAQKFSYFGEDRTVREWMDDERIKAVIATGVSPVTMQYRIRRGANTEELLRDRQSSVSKLRQWLFKDHKGPSRDKVRRRKVIQMEESESVQ